MELPNNAEVKVERGSLSSGPSSKEMTRKCVEAMLVLQRSYVARDHARQGGEALTKERPFVLNNNPFCPLKAYLKCHHEVVLSLLFEYVLIRIIFCWAS